MGTPTLAAGRMARCGACGQHLHILYLACIVASSLLGGDNARSRARMPDTGYYSHLAPSWFLTSALQPEGRGKYTWSDGSW